MPPTPTCPISRADFLAKSEPLKIDSNGFPMTAEEARAGDAPGRAASNLASNSTSGGQ